MTVVEVKVVIIVAEVVVRVEAVALRYKHFFRLVQQPPQQAVSSNFTHQNVPKMLVLHSFDNLYSCCNSVHFPSSPSKLI